MTTFKIAVTGHRPHKLLAAEIDIGIIRMKMREFLETTATNFEEEQMWDGIEVISGMAPGVDQYFAEIAQQYDIPVTAAVPFEKFYTSWNNTTQKKYFHLLRKCKEVKIISEEPGKDAYLQRNRWMVENCNKLIAFQIPGSTGGTAYTINYAKNYKRCIKIIELV